MIVYNLNVTPLEYLYEITYYSVINNIYIHIMVLLIDV